MGMQGEKALSNSSNPVEKPNRRERGVRKGSIWANPFLIPAALRFLFVSSLLIVCATQPAIAQVESSSRWSVKKLIEFHQQHHLRFKAQDAFKMFYQASFGVEHILFDTSAVASYLTSELTSIDTPSSVEPLIERISLENDMVRINLRPLKALNLSPSDLVKVMFQSAAETISDTVMFYRQWNEFSSLVKYGILKFTPDDIKLWDSKVEAGTIAPVHHSPEYREASHPAYRVVRLSVFEAAFGKMKE